MEKFLSYIFLQVRPVFQYSDKTFSPWEKQGEVLWGSISSESPCRMTPECAKYCRTCVVNHWNCYFLFVIYIYFSEVKENGVEEDAVRDPNIFRETREKEEVYILMKTVLCPPKFRASLFLLGIKGLRFTIPWPGSLACWNIYT